MNKATWVVGRLFAVTFVSAFLLFFGVAGLVLSFAPALASMNLFDSEQPSYHLLPTAEDRDANFLDVDSLAGKQLFPPEAELGEVQPGNWIRIPSIGVAVPLAASPTILDADVIKTLEQGAALYPNGIVPGRLGNVFIAAHSTGNPWHGKYRFAFLKINEVQPGHVITLDYENTRYTYRVVSSDIVAPTDDYKVISDRPVPSVTLMACWPLWSTSKRMLVRAELTNITKLTAQPS